MNLLQYYIGFDLDQSADFYATSLTKYEGWAVIFAMISALCVVLVSSRNYFYRIWKKEREIYDKETSEYNYYTGRRARVENLTELIYVKDGVYWHSDLLSGHVYQTDHTWETIRLALREGRIKRIFPCCTYFEDIFTGMIFGAKSHYWIT